MITFGIPSKNNKRYLQAAIPSILKNSHYDNKVIVFVDGDNDGTVEWLESLNEPNVSFLVNPKLNEELFDIGKAYDYLIEKAETEMVCVFHADMMLAKDADKYMMEVWEEKSVVCATRIEPPLHPEGPEKIVKDFGLWPETDIEDGFKEAEFDEYVQMLLESEHGQVTEGLFAPWLVSKTDFNAVGGHDYRFRSAREDSDLFNRFLLAGYKLKQTWRAFVYHLTARAGQFEHGVLTKEHTEKSKDWQVLMEASTKEYFRKWHTPVLHDEYMKPIVPPVYHTTIVAQNSTDQMIELLEPWCDQLYVDSDINTIVSFIAKNQQYTKDDLSEKVLYNNHPRINGDVVIHIDCNDINNEVYNYFALLSRIIDDSGQVKTTQKLGPITLVINKKEDLRDKLIVNDKQ